MKDNNQSDNLRALIDAGVRSFKIEGRYKDLGYVKNITAHYRKLLDEIIEEGEFARASSGRTTFSFTPDPDQNFNREFTDYFVNGRKDDIGAFDTPKTLAAPLAGSPNLGDWFELEVSDKATMLHNGDGLCYYDLQKSSSAYTSTAPVRERQKGIWRVFPKNDMAEFKGSAQGPGDQPQPRHGLGAHAGEKSSDRRIGLGRHAGGNRRRLCPDVDRRGRLRRQRQPGAGAPGPPPTPPRPKPCCANNWGALALRF